MNIVVGGVRVIGDGNGGTREWGQLVYALKEFLVNQAGWTVAGSSNGTTGGMDAVDRITSNTTIAGTTTWVVLRSPHASAADRIQLLLGGSASDTTNYVAYNPNADYAGVTTAFPTSSYSVVVSTGTFFNANAGSPDYQYNFLADTQAPYGWFAAGHQFAVPTVNSFRPGSIGFIPLQSQVSFSPGKPYVVFSSLNNTSVIISNLGNTTALTTQSRCVAEPYSPPQIPVASPANRFYMSTGVTYPGAVMQSTASEDLTCPIVFQSDTYLFGVSDFMRWNGVLRNWGDTLSNGSVDRARIVFGDVNLPWDGVSIPRT